MSTNDICKCIYVVLFVICYCCFIVDAESEICPSGCFAQIPLDPFVKTRTKESIVSLYLRPVEPATGTSFFLEQNHLNLASPKP